MRIVYLHQYFNTPQMSGGTRSYEFARRLVDAGHSVHMITSDRNSSGEIYETVEDGIRVTWIPVQYSNTMGAVSRIRAFIAFAVKSSLIAANSEADVIFATSTPLTVAIPGIYAKWRQRAPMIFEVRDLWPEMPIALGVLKDPLTKYCARQLERFAYRNSDHIVALSPGMKQGIVSAGYPPEKVTVISNASDIERFSVDHGGGNAFRERFEWLGNRQLVVYTGTLGVLNGVGYLAHVAAEMRKHDPEIRFLVVGAGKDEENVRRLARRLDVYERNFFMLPRIPKADVRDVLSAADICTSLFLDIEEMWANSANKFFDALAAGRPVAINYEGWHAKLLREHEAGIVLDPIDHVGAARALHEKISDVQWLNRARGNASQLAKTRFSRELLATQFESVLRTHSRAE